MTNHLLYGAAYYAEYLPEDRLEQDMEMMKAAGFNLIRVAESTWSTMEPQEGIFDFSILIRVLRAAQAHGISVIVGTPSYAIPPWLAKKYPDILAETHQGTCRYGARQIFDLTHPGYLFHTERIIRKLLEAVQPFPCVIGFQLDNETKHYDICSLRVQKRFKEWLQEQFPSLEAFNHEMGFAYWSNRLGSWDDLPDVRGTINASFGAMFQEFQRSLVSEFLLWQRQIIEEYRRPEQFVTHNFDYEWRGISVGLQPDASQFEAAKAVTVAGCDIYHKSGKHLNGADITFCGAVARGLKRDNYFVLETQAQGIPGWLPYPGQLKLQAFSHLANGADCVEYWHWHSIHNAVESYWKGVLSHDFSPGTVYQEAAEIGQLFQKLSPKLLHLKKKNRVAVMVSNRSQAGLQWFPTCRQEEKPPRNYSDYLRWICDSLYRLNIEYDIIPDTPENLPGYDLLILPCLYAASEELLSAVSEYVRKGGGLIAAFKTGFANEHLKIYHDAQPHRLSECLGIHYDRFTVPQDTELSSSKLPFPERTAVSDWMELLVPDTAEVLCRYQHPVWGGIPAITKNIYGKGSAVYLGCYFDESGLDALLQYLLPEFRIPLPAASFPVIVKSGINQYGRLIQYYFNYSDQPQETAGPDTASHSLLENADYQAGARFSLPPWGVRIFESQPPA